MKRTWNPLENSPVILPDVMPVLSACPDSHRGRGFCKSNILRSFRTLKGIFQRQVSLSRSHPRLPQLRTHHFFPAPEKPPSSRSCRPSPEAEWDQGTPSSFLRRHPLQVVVLALGSPNFGLCTVVTVMAVSPVPGVRLGLGRS